MNNLVKYSYNIVCNNTYQYTRVILYYYGRNKRSRKNSAWHI